MRRAANAQSGFTLVEVLAALAVFAIAAIGLSQSTGESTRGAAHMEARFLAGIVADNQMVEAMIDPAPLRVGAITGTAIQRGRSYNWTRLVAPTERRDVIAVSITVSDPNTQQVLAQLEALKWVSP